MEYWWYRKDKIWNTDDKVIIQLAFEEMEMTGLMENNKVLDGKVIRINKCYPLYESHDKKNLEPVEKYLDDIKNLNVIGRYDTFKYSNQDHSIYMGILAVENISENKNHYLWGVNTDYEDYQESH